MNLSIANNPIFPNLLTTCFKLGFNQSYQPDLDLPRHGARPGKIRLREIKLTSILAKLGSCSKSVFFSIAELNCSMLTTVGLGVISKPTDWYQHQLQKLTSTILQHDIGKPPVDAPISIVVAPSTDKSKTCKAF